VTKVDTFLSLLAGGGISGLLWAELAYRVRLFFRYGVEPYLNHVGDGYFGLMYTLEGGGALILGFGAVVAYRRRCRVLCFLHLAVAAVALAHMVTFVLLRRCHILVTYSEFIHRHGP